MNKYICIGLLEDPPYNVIIDSTDLDPQEWVNNLSLKSHLIGYNSFRDAEKIINKIFNSLEAEGISASRNKFFSCPTYKLVNSFIKARDEEIREHIIKANSGNQNDVSKLPDTPADFKVNKGGPFGLYMGMSLEELNSNYDEVAPNTYQISTVPQPHSAFEQYLIKVSPKHGLFWIKAIGKTIVTSRHGIELKLDFQKIVEKLSGTYGKGEISDFLLPGSIWNEPEDFMMGLVNKERTLLSIWENHGMKNNLKTIGVIGSAIDGNSGYISLEYYFENDAIAEQELSEIEDDSL